MLDLQAGTLGAEEWGFLGFGRESWEELGPLGFLSPGVRSCGNSGRKTNAWSLCGCSISVGVWVFPPHPVILAFTSHMPSLEHKVRKGALLHLRL